MPLNNPTVQLGLQGCRLYRSTNQTIQTATLTAISFDTEIYDTDAMHEGVTNPSRITFTTEGKYIVMINFRWTSNATGVRETSIRRSAGNTEAWTTLNAVGSGIAAAPFLACIADFAAGDYVEAMVTQTSGGPLDIIASSPYTPIFTAHRIGTKS